MYLKERAGPLRAVDYRFVMQRLRFQTCVTLKIVMLKLHLKRY